MATQAEITLSIKVDKNAASQNLSSINKEMKELKEEQRLLNEQVKAGTITQENYEKALAANSLRLKDLSTQAQNANKIVNSQKGSIDELTASLNFNRKAYNALSDEQKANDNIGGKLKNTINQQASSLQDMNASIGKPGLRGGLSAALSGMISTLGSMAIAFVSVGTVMKVFNGVINTTQTAGDAWALSVATVNGALEGLYLTIGTGDWSNLFDNMVKSSKAAKELAKNLDDLFETTISRDYRAATIEKDIADLTLQRDIARKNKQYALASEFVEKIKKKEEERDENAIRVANKRAKMYMDNITTITGISEKEFLQFLSVYNTAENEKIKERAETFIEEEAKIRNQSITMQTSAGAITVQISKDQADKEVEILKKKYTQEEIIQAQFTKNLNRLSEKQVDDAAKAFTDKLALETKHKEESRRNTLVGVVSGNKEDDFGNKLEDKTSEKIVKANEDVTKSIEDKNKATEDYFKTLDATSDEIQKILDEDLSNTIKRLDDEKKAREEFNTYLIDSQLELKDLNNQLIEDEFAKAEEDNELWLEAANIKAEENKNRLLEDIKGTEDFAARKIEIEKTADDIITANKKLAAKIQKGIEADKRRYVVDEIMKTTGSIMEFTDALNEKQKTAKKAALLIDSGASIASVVINYIDAASEGFKQMGPIAGIAGGILMTIQSVAAVATIVAKTAQGIAAIDKVDTKSSSGGDKTPAHFALGGWIGGSSHQDGGVNINAEGGEFMVNKRAMMNPQIANFVNAANSWGNGGNGGAPLLTEERVAQIASAVVGAIPVYIVESAITNKQREVQVRESKFIV